MMLVDWSPEETATWLCSLFCRKVQRLCTPKRMGDPDEVQEAPSEVRHRPGQVNDHHHSLLRMP